MKHKFCPHCGSDYGLYSIERVTYEQYYDYDGDATGHGEFDSNNHRMSTPLYCIDCRKKVTTLQVLLED